MSLYTLFISVSLSFSLPVCTSDSVSFCLCKFPSVSHYVSLLVFPFSLFLSILFSPAIFLSLFLSSLSLALFFPSPIPLSFWIFLKLGSLAPFPNEMGSFSRRGNAAQGGLIFLPHHQLSFHFRTPGSGRKSFLGEVPRAAAEATQPRCAPREPWRRRD